MRAGKKWGVIDGGGIHYNDMSAGGLGDLTIIRYYTPPRTDLMPASALRASKRLRIRGFMEKPWLEHTPGPDQVRNTMNHLYIRNGLF